MEGIKIACRANLLLRDDNPISAPPRNSRIEIWNKTRLLIIFCHLVKLLTILKQFFMDWIFEPKFLFYAFNCLREKGICVCICMYM
jgi:hypothetical protein